MTCHYCGYEDFRPANEGLIERLITALVPVVALRCKICGARTWIRDRRVLTWSRGIAWALLFVALTWGLKTYRFRQLDELVYSPAEPPGIAEEAQPSEAVVPEPAVEAADSPPLEIDPVGGGTRPEARAPDTATPRPPSGEPEPARLDDRTESELQSAREAVVTDRPENAVEDASDATESRLRLTSRQEDDCLRVQLEAGRSIQTTRTFAMSDPERWVIDFAGSWDLESSTYLVENSFVEKIRLGIHPDHTRLVFDLVEPASRPRAEQTGTGLSIRLCRAERLE